VSNISNRERLLRVFHQQEVDRVPVSPFIHINYVKEFFNSHDVDWVEKTPEVYHHFGFDIIHRNCSIVYNPFGLESKDWKISTTRERDGRDETTTTAIETPRGELRWRRALRWVCEFDVENSLLEYPIKSPSDFELFESFQSEVEEPDVADIGKAKEAVADDGVIAPWIQGAFNLVALYYRKLDELLMDPVLEPLFYERMMKYFLGRYKKYVQKLIDAGVDLLSYGANVANGKLVGADFYEKYVWPYEKDLIVFIQDQGVAVLFHNCGYARNLLPLYSTLDLRAYESLAPPPYGDTLLEEAVEIMRPGTTLVGGIDQLDLMRTGSVHEIERTVKNVLETVRGKRHFILGTTDYLNENTPNANIRALAEAGRRYGRL
jgi:uroporphyrinogen decarboxylase